MIDIRAKLLAAFRVEYKDHLEYIRSTLNKLETGEAEPCPKILNEIFRRAHSLKGAARAADLAPIEILAHRMETLLSRVQSNAVSLAGPAAKVLLEVSDAVEDWVEAFMKEEKPASPDAALQAIDQFLAATGKSGTLKVKESAAPPPAADTPPPPKIPQETAVTPRQDFSPTIAAETSIRVSSANLDRLLRSAGQLMTENVSQQVVSRKLRSIERVLSDVERVWSLLGGVSAKIRQEGNVTRHLDAMDRHVRQLSKEVRSMRLVQQRSAWMLRQLGGELQDEIRLVRMAPVENVFGGFRKMIRDLARNEGKEIDVRVIGLEVKADRLVLQALKDPLMHMVRNAIYHGIETPQERAAGDKDKTGRLILGFKVEGGRLCVEVNDDGRGLDFKKIAAKGVSEGLLTKKEAASASQRELLSNIFKPGFSTAGEITDLAGRGMGMSVVQETVAHLNGSIEVVAKDGPGTFFRLLVPLSISTHRLLMIVSHGHIFAVPTDGIERLCRVHIDEIKTVEGAPVINFHGSQIPLQGLASLLGLGSNEINVQKGVMPVMILNSAQTRVAIAVDSLIAIRDAVIKDLGFPLPHGSKVTGGILLEDGSISTVLSPFALVEAFRRPGAAKALATEEMAPEKKPPTILVVDDSITTRTLEKSILEAYGYRVIIAVDGLEALTELRSQPIDLVVSDIQMPRLDGFGLLTEIKKDPSIANIPIIMVTSMESDKDRERGLSLGADAYVIKQKFDQKDLLDTIEQML